MTWPNFFIVGAPRSGTSSLYEYLRNTSGIYMSPVKEPHFFDRKVISDDFIIKPIRDEKKYLKLFEKVTNEKIIGEASPGYLRDPEAPRLIHEKSPNAKIVIILRDPVERAFSHYLMTLSLGYENDSFTEIIKKNIDELVFDNYRASLAGSMYYEQVKRYFDMFGRASVKILIFEEFAKDTKKHVQDVLHFLNVDSKPPNSVKKTFNAFATPRNKLAQYIVTHGSVRSLAFKILSPSIRLKLKENFILKTSKKPEMSQNDRDILIKFFFDDVKKLQSLLNMTFPWKNFKTLSFKLKFL